LKPIDEQVKAGQAVYTKSTLCAYDIIVLGISNQYIWKCPSARIDDHYNKNVSANHLDVGVGTGYFLDRCSFPSESPRVALMDLNPSTLDFASKRISRYAPETYKQNILEPISADIPQFDSVGINYLLHCVPGTIVEKAVAFDHLSPFMNPGATFFGSTILQGGVTRNWAATQLMKIYNEKGIFSNLADDLEGLKHALNERFQDVSVEVVGCAALFSGHIQ
jgi:2-polyprenyl-3-methyl-5-hydroxy-6-metoxy-1,4-benzoquinol methylase